MSKTIKVIFVLSILLAFSVGVASSQAINETIEVVLARDISFELDGEPHVFRDPDGQTQYPLIYEGSSYLPVRSIAEAAGVEVDWDGNTRTIILNRDVQDLDDTPYKDAQDYEPGEPGEQDFGFTILPPQWAEESPSMEAVEDFRGRYGPNYEIYLLEFHDSGTNVTSATYIVTDLAYDSEFSLKVNHRDSISIVNHTNESQQIPYFAADERRTTASISAGESSGMSAPRDQVIQRAELRNMQGNLLWNY